MNSTFIPVLVFEQRSGWWWWWWWWGDQTLLTAIQQDSGMKYEKTKLKCYCLVTYYITESSRRVSSRV